MAMLLCIALIGFNAWWYWRDARPAPDIKTIEALMSREQYIQAESALRERLRRSRQDGEARLLLARTLAARGDTQGCALQLREIPYWWPTKAEALFHEGQAYLMADRAKDAETCWLAVIKDNPLHPSPPDITQAASHQLLGLYATENRRDDAAEVIWETYERTRPADHLALLGMRVKSELERLAPEATIGQLERYVAADRTDWEALRRWPVPNWLWAARKTPITISRPVSRDVPMTLEFGVTTSACFTTWGTRMLGRRSWPRFRPLRKANPRSGDSADY